MLSPSPATLPSGGTTNLPRSERRRVKLPFRDPGSRVCVCDCGGGGDGDALSRGGLPAAALACCRDRRLGRLCNPDVADANETPVDVAAAAAVAGIGADAWSCGGGVGCSRPKLMSCLAGTSNCRASLCCDERTL